jgi:3-ketoacyl-CoA synthase
LSEEEMSNTPETNDKLPDLISRLEVKMDKLRKGYAHYQTSALFLIIVVPILAVMFTALKSTDLSEIGNVVSMMFDSVSFLTALLSMLVLAFVVTVFYLKKPLDVYLLDFACFDAPEEHMVDHEKFMKVTREVGIFDEDSIVFQEKLLAKSAVGRTAFPPGISMKFPPQTALSDAMEEARLVMFTCVENVLKSTGLRAKDIDVLVVNCSLFCPTPSLSAMIVNHFKMRSNILAYSLGGMGCSAGLISVDLAKRMLDHHPKFRALVVSTENITQNWYKGNDKSMLVTNTLFREGGAAVILSNHPADRHLRKLRLLHVIRTHRGADDLNFGCVVQREDDRGTIGVSLSKDVMKVAGDALQDNITNLGTLVLPWSEQINFFTNLVARLILTRKLPNFLPKPLKQLIYLIGDFLLAYRDPKDSSLYANFCRMNRNVCSLPGSFSDEELSKLKEEKKAPVGKPYVPDFTKAFKHICVHAGGRAVLEAIEKNLKLPSSYLEASRHVLYNFGNTSSSSIWYEMRYHFRNSRIKKSDRVWQIAFGSGFKCNSAVWESLKSI